MAMMANVLRWPSLVALGFLLLLGSGVWTFAGEAPDFTAQSLEELMPVKIPTVVAASKHERKNHRSAVIGQRGDTGGYLTLLKP